MAKIPDLKRVIPGLGSDPGGRPYGLETWLGWHGKYEDALAYSWLIWPPFTELEGCVFLGSEVPATYPEWKAKYGSDTRAIEGMMNHRHIGDIFLSAGNPSQEMVARWIGVVDRGQVLNCVHVDLGVRS